MMSKVKQLQMAVQAGDKVLAAKLVKEVKAQAARGVAKSEKLVKDIEALQAKLKRD